MLNYTFSEHRDELLQTISVYAVCRCTPPSRWAGHSLVIHTTCATTKRRIPSVLAFCVQCPRALVDSATSLLPTSSRATEPKCGLELATTLFCYGGETMYYSCKQVFAQVFEYGCV